MPGCAAVGCSNRSERGFKLYVFPKEKCRRIQWLINLRRKDWQPSGSSYVCEVHFEDSQFEQHRADGWKKLKPNAVPTLFNIPNPPPKINPPPRKSVYKINKQGGTATATSSHKGQTSPGIIIEAGQTISSSKESLPTLEDFSQGDSRNKNKVEHSYSRIDRTARSPCLVIESPNEECIPGPSCAPGPPVSAPTDQFEAKYLAVVEENKHLRRQLEDATVALKSTLEKENEILRTQLQQANSALESFLNKNQIQCLEQGRMSSWLTESKIKGLKFRFALSVHGYNFLRETGYPLPSYTTLMRRLRQFQLTFGIFTDILEPLKVKVDTMPEDERFCVLSYDEMVINEQIDFDKSTGKFYGNATLGEGQGQKIFTVLARGVRSSWKQIIACHVTPRTNVENALIRDFVLECITFVESCGLYVVALSSDMDNRNRNLWTSLGISVSKNGTRVNYFRHNGHEIFAIPDVCHLLKNLKAAMLRQTVHLPPAFAEFHGLSDAAVKGSYIVDLWNQEINQEAELRKLHHLRRQDVEPSQFHKMNVGAAVRFFSAKTAAALETAVKENILPKDAVSTAAFIRLVEEWFGILSSKVRKCSITQRNCDRKYIFLHGIIDIFQGIVFEKNWKPLNFGVILATLSFCDIAQFLFSKRFDFVLGHRFTQDATENIFSQVRNKEGALPTALKCLRALKTISVAQFVSDVKRTNYFTDADSFLVDFFHAKRDVANTNISTSTGTTISTSCANMLSIANVSVSTLSVEHLCERISKSSLKLLFHITGSTIHAVMRHLCNDCGVFLLRDNFPANFPLADVKSYTVALNFGGLKEVFCYESFLLILHCEYFYLKYKAFILKNGYMQVTDEIHKNVEVNFPPCCNVKSKIIKRFFTVRSYCVKSFSENKRKLEYVYGSASSKRRKT